MDQPFYTHKRCILKRYKFKEASRNLKAEKPPGTQCSPLRKEFKQNQKIGIFHLWLAGVKPDFHRTQGDLQVAVYVCHHFGPS